MGRKTKSVRPQQRTISIDDCRIRLLRGEPTTFVDARRTEDWDASEIKVAAALRFAPGEGTAYLPCPKHNYIVVYCA
jgi:hypothetical protein